MCNRALETMEHIITCSKARQLWEHTHALLKSLGEPHLRDKTSDELLTALITNTNNLDQPASDTARAIWRVSLRQHYAAIVRVDTEEKKYNSQEVYLSTLQSLRTIATDCGEKIRLRIESARLTSNPTTVSKKTRKKATPLLLLGEDGKYEVNSRISEETVRITSAIQHRQRRAHRTTTAVVRALPPLPLPPATG